MTNQTQKQETMRSPISFTPQDAITLQAFVNALANSSSSLESLQPQLVSIGEKIAQQQSCLLQCIRSLVSKNPQFARLYRQERMHLKPYEKKLDRQRKLSEWELESLQKQLFLLADILRSPDTIARLATYKNQLAGSETEFPLSFVEIPTNSGAN